MKRRRTDERGSAPAFQICEDPDTRIPQDGMSVFGREAFMYPTGSQYMDYEPAWEHHQTLSEWE